MAVCKTCGCAIPLGSRRCDMCAVTGAVAPAQQPLVWQPPNQATAPTELAPSAASGAVTGAAVRPPLPAEIQKAQKRVRHAWQFIAFIGALSIVAGTVAELGNIDLLQNYFDWYAVAEGAIFLVLAYFVRRGSLIALGIAIGLYALDTVALFATGHFGIIRILILLYLLRSFGSANLLRRHRKALAQQPAAQEQPRAA
jgi:hypothetical protein